MSVMDKILKKARADLKTIVLNESFDERVREAAKMAAQAGIAHVVLVGSGQETEKKLAGFASDNLTVVDPKQSEKTAGYAEALYNLRKPKGMTREKAAALVGDTLVFGALMVASGDADGMVTGAATASSDVLRTAFQIVRCKPDVPVASSCQILDLSDNPFLDATVWVVADGVVNINPTAQQLAGIAVSTAQTYRQLFGEPKMAMLSFSTRGSASHEMVDKVAEATKLAKQAAPDLLIDGEMQLDAAIIDSVGRFKCPDSPVAGQANVLIFPDLQCGNIGYKLIERVGGAQFLGCIVQGLNSPVNDMSRGCNAKDIFNTIAMTAVQAQAQI